MTITAADGQDNDVELIAGADIPELKRVSVFDTVEARSYLTETNPLGFRPAGFDIFPEMARVYDRIAEKLEAEIIRRTAENSFPSSFIRPDSDISRFVAGLGPATDLAELRSLATFGEREEARLAEVARQITELQTQSVDATLALLTSAKKDVEATQSRLADRLALLSEAKRTEYGSLLTAQREKLAAVAAVGAASFKRGFFHAIGTPEWDAFLGAASDLGKAESLEYPVDGDYCLLCHGLLDDDSLALIHRFWDFLGSEVQREALAAQAAAESAADNLEALEWSFLDAETTARAQIVRMRPNLVAQLDAVIGIAAAYTSAMAATLRGAIDHAPEPFWEEPSREFGELLTQIEGDIARLQERNAGAALEALEQERVTLRHRQVLSQLLPHVERYVADQSWSTKAAGVPRRALNPRHLTDKESDLFATVIADGYRRRFDQECRALDCEVPVEMHTQGHRGQTVRSLKIRGTYKPDQILNEGEQRVVALADFLTEVSLNPAATGIILDDPVNSQDHRRKTRIARRLVEEAKERQVIVFTHDMVFLTKLVDFADGNVDLATHWVERDGDGSPGRVTLDDSPADSPQYRKTDKARQTLDEAKRAAGTLRHRLVQRGMGELRRTIEEVVSHFLFKTVVRRWSDRVIVTALKKIAWDDNLVTEIVQTYEDISAYIEGHSHPEESSGAPPDPTDLEAMIGRVAGIIHRARKER